LRFETPVLFQAKNRKTLRVGALHLNAKAPLEEFEKLERGFLFAKETS
jgi:hypothetical protein